MIDIENLMGGPREGLGAMRYSSSAYKNATSIGEHDHVVLGMNPAIAIEVADLWQGSRILVRKGPDGADTVLIDHVRNVNWIAARYDRIIIGSGDGIFTVVARAYRSVGVPVGVVTRRTALSASLRKACSSVTYLTAPVPAEVIA